MTIQQQLAERLYQLLPHKKELVDKVYIKDFRHPIDAENWVNRFVNIKSIDITPIHEKRDNGYTSCWVKVEIIGQSLRLSDLLLAIKKGLKDEMEIYLSLDNQYGDTFITWVEQGIKIKDFKIDLSKDNILDQSDGFCKFALELLSNNTKE